MKIKKSPPKKLINPPTKIQQLVDTLANCPENELHKVIKENSPWKNQKSDLYHWISVLNRFDLILESINQKFELKHIQTINFDEDTKNLLLSILTFTRYLWENCINRNIYNSYEHLNLLLNTNDIDILEALLRLMLKFAQRLGNNNSRKVAIAISLDKIYTLYHSWISNDFNLTYSQLLNAKTKLPDECFNLTYHYYKSGKQAAQAQAQVQNITQKVETLTTKHSKSSLKHKASIDGLISINLNKSQLFEKSTQEIYQDLLNKYDIPSEHKFSIYHRIRFLKSIQDYEQRLKYITIRLFALSIYVQMIEEDVATAKVFVYEPDLISNMAEILQSDDPKTYGIQTAILSVFDGIIRYKSKNTFVLAAINSSTNYGILSFIFRKVIKNLDMDVMEIPQEFVDIFFTLVSYIISLQGSTNTLAMQVTVNLLLLALENKRLDRYKNLTKCIILLDNFLLIKNQVFSIFIEENGLDKVLNRIQYEVNYNVKLIEDSNAKSCNDQNMQDAETGKEVFPRDEKDIVPHESMVLLRASLKLILHLMQTSGSSDRMRNLIDSSLASSLYSIFKYYKNFGILVYGLTIEIMSTFIHNEPTCLNILQEAKLPQIFLETVNKGVLVSAEAINEIPTAFGAVCLNSVGMNQFNEAKPADKYFEIFTSEEYMRVFTGNYIVNSIGNGIDELIRHHPAIKLDIIKSIVKMINKLMDEISTAPLENTTGIFLYNVEEDKNKIKPDNENQKSENDSNIPVYLQQLSLCFKFLDGLFQNNYHRNEFIENGGFDAIIKFYSLPYIPFNLVALPASFYCSKTIKSLVEANEEKVVTIILEKLIDFFNKMDSKLESIKDFSFDKYIYIKDETTLNDGNEIMHLLISILTITELLNDLLITNKYRVMNQHILLKDVIMSKPDITKKIIKLVGKYNNICSWNFLKLRFLQNSQWFEYIENYKFNYGKKLMKSDISEYMVGSLSPKKTEDEMSKLESEINVEDPAFKNFKYLQFLLKRYIITSVTLHEAMSKVLMTRKNSDDDNTRKTKFAFIDCFSECILNALEYPYKEKPVSEVHTLRFLNMYLNLIANANINERSSNFFHIQFIKALSKKENRDILNKVFYDLWNQNKELNESKKENKCDELEEKLDLNNQSISKIMNLFIYLSSYDAINGSGYLHYILTFEETKVNGFIVIMRHFIIKIILDIWKDENIKNAPPETINGIVTVIKNILKANGENGTELKAIKPPPILFQKPKVKPNPEQLAILMDMGFPRKACERALIECSNNVSRATDYLLSHPELIEENEESTPTTAPENNQSSSNNNINDNVSTEGNASTSNENNNIASSSNENPSRTSVESNNGETSNNNEGETSTNNNEDVSMSNAEEINDITSAMNDIFGDFDMMDESDRNDLTRALEMSLESSVPSIFKFSNLFSGFEAERTASPLSEEIDKTRKNLNELREVLKKEVEDWLYSIMEFAEESINNIKSLLVSLNKETDQIKNIIKKVISDIEDYHKNNNLYSVGERSRYRLLLKFINDQGFKNTCVEEIKNLIISSINMFINETNDEHLEWFMPSLLLIDIFIVNGKNNFPEEEENEEEIGKDSSKVFEKMDSSISKDLQFKIIEKIIFFMNNYDIKNDILHCFYRLIIELIYDYNIAQYFISINGLKALFRSKVNKSSEIFQGQNNLIIIILRHLVEQPEILKELFKKEIFLQMNRVRQSTTDIKNYIMTVFPYIIERNPQLFIESSIDVCKLTSPNPDYYITLQKNYIKKNNSSDNDEEVLEEEINEQNEENKSTTSDIQSSKVKIEDDNKGKIEESKIIIELNSELVKATEPIINFLIEEFIECKSMNSVSSLNEVLQLPEIQSLTANNKTDTNNNGENSTEKEKDVKLKAAQEMIAKEKNLILNEHAFIIQCLTELVFSYPTCKMNLVNYCKDNKKLGSKKLLTYLIEEYILNDLIENSLEEESQNQERNKHKFRYIESNIFIKLFYNLISTESYDFEKLQNYSLETLRKNVIEVIGQCLKDSLSRQGTLEQKYRYYSGLAKLCLKLINFKPQHISKKFEEFPLAIAKLMLENNYVILLTNMVSDVDVNHPQASHIIYNLIKPLDLLVLSAIEINKYTETTTVIQVQEEGSNNIPNSNGDSEIPRDEEHEISDMYRTSALGIFSGENENNEDDDDDDGDLEDEDDFDEDDFDEDGFIGTEEDMSDESEISDIEEDSEEDDENPDVEMEIVMRPYENEGDDDDDDDDDDNGNGNDEIEEIEVDEDDDNNDNDVIVEDGINNPDNVIIMNENDDQMRWETPYSIHEDDMSIDNILQNNEVVGANGSDLGSGNTEIVRVEDSNINNDGIIEVGDEGEEEDDDDDDNELNDEEEIDEFLHADEEDDDDLLGYNRRFIWDSDEREEDLTPEQENWLNGRSGVMEIQLSPQGIEFRLPNSSDPRNIENILRAIDNRIIRPQTNNNEINTHPLLSGRPTTNENNDGRFSNDQSQIGNRALQFMERLFQEINPSFVNSIRMPNVINSTLFLPNDDQYKSMNDNISIYNILSTQKRWKQEYRFLNINPNKKYNKYIQKCIIDKLLPEAIEEEKKRKEEEERKKKAEEEKKKKQMEEERKRKEEEERKRQEELEENARQQRLQEQATSASNNENSDAVMTDNNNNNASSNEQSTERVTVMVNGREVDITNTGIDPTFLEALPDDLRQEIIDQHISETRANQASAATLSSNDEFNNEFLFALPDEIREEVMQYDRFERERRNVDRRMIDSNRPFGMDNNLYNLYYGNENGMNPFNPFLIPKKTVTKKKIIKEKKELGQLLEKPALASIIRLLFIQKGSATVEAIQKILSNLSKNSKTRSEVISILLCILIDGSSDLADVDKNFAQMSIKNKGKASTKKSISSSTPNQNIHSSNDYIPNLVAKRSLDTLIYLVANNEQIRQYFLTSNENFNVNLTRKPSLKKLKGKEKTTTYKYPIVILLSLLDRSSFLTNPILMEKTTFLLSQILRNLGQPSSNDKEENKNDTSANNDNQHGNVDNSSGDSKINVTSKSKSSVSKSQKTPNIHIPIHYCNSIVNIFIVSECTIKTFQNTLIILQSISSLKEYYNAIMHQLVNAVQKIIDDIQSELIDLTKTLSDQSIEVQKLTFHDLTSASSKQAQILRILKAIDFLETKRISKSRNNSSDELNQNKMKDITSNSNSNKEENSTSSNKDDKITAPPNKKLISKPNEDELLHIYDQLTIKPLWNKLGHILTIINNNRDLIHVATILLPLIESFMVISKPYVLDKPEKYQSSVQLLNSDPNDMDNQTNEEIFYSMTNEHRKILNTMVRNNPSLMKNSFALLVSNSKILDFDNKRTYFNQQLHKRNTREHFGTLQIAVRRQYVFEDSFHKLQGKTGNEIKYSKLNVRFAEEEGVDVGGITREWFSALARQMFNPDYALFKPSAVDRVTYQPNRNSWINPDHLSFFKFVGRIIGKAIYDGRCLDCYFTRSFYKHILNIDVDYKDIEAIDPEYFKSLEWILHNDITDVLDLTFSLEIDEFGKKSIIDLKPDGRNIPVTEDNKVEYVKLVTEQRLTVAIKKQIEAFLDGFHDIIPHSLISIFNEQELELLISGLPDIDIDDWKNNTVYENYSSSSPQVQWFWRAVRSFTQEERAKLIQFTTGTSKVPLEGFSSLQGVNGIQKFQIHKDFGSIERLPSAHTCFNQLDIPAYESYEHLRKALLLAINECSVGFGFA
ncbi:hypothetical protein BCR36DRAFT_332465 [Piromyces finnis]|uniref:HECT-type E3 ubiquitin transferase n=1 Tax=Piromyces finnis TaxID=1754191 RepID=A0A1Y1V3R3_9FUNG|nr:hypothetical protein BCR36DRAFT_332465 [Piromyces finnis]|eukprot:ORX45978.1 hypothetical protein BCR36DRAFT_332465 [Piromyces finnis]